MSNDKDPENFWEGSARRWGDHLRKMRVISEEELRKLGVDTIEWNKILKCIEECRDSARNKAAMEKELKQLSKKILAKEILEDRRREDMRENPRPIRYRKGKRKK